MSESISLSLSVVVLFTQAHSHDTIAGLGVSMSKVPMSKHRKHLSYLAALPSERKLAQPENIFWWKLSTTKAHLASKTFH